MTKRIFQLNLQKHFGGGEVYTHFLCQALDRLDIPHTLITSDDTNCWDTLSFNKTKLEKSAANISSILNIVGKEPSIFITHGNVAAEWREAIKSAGHKLIGIAHMPLYGRNPDSYLGYDGVIGVSQYVVNSLKDSNTSNVYENPWYGVASLERNVKPHQQLVANSKYDWDLRKGRDRLFSWLEPLYLPLKKQQEWHKKEGITVGIVSRITPIKQFPLMFEHIAQALTDVPNLNIEIIGSGGYASVRDLKKALEPLKDKVRFWGFQNDINQVYGNLDFLLTGLPEKEALGLNVIEAQALGLPVLAVNAMPFTETVLDEKSGFLFTDPREDNGQHLAKILTDIQSDKDKYPEPLKHAEHLHRFSLDSFTKRVEQSLEWLSS